MPYGVQHLKQQIPLLDYLRKRSWEAQPMGSQEFVGLCPLHPESRPSFYVNAAKNVFYCHGCGRGGDLVRFVELSLNLSFPETLVHLNQELGSSDPCRDQVLRETVGFYRNQLGLHADACAYLRSRGLRDAGIIQQLGIGYAPGGMLRQHLTRLGYPIELLLQRGIIVHGGQDAFYRRIVFPCFDGNRIVNIYGRSIHKEAPHRFLPGSRGGLFAWSTVASSSDVILVEGPFDLAVLWQAGFVNTTCAFGTRLNQTQLLQLCDQLNRMVFIAFDSDSNGAGQNAARSLARQLERAGLNVRIVDLPEGQDPNSYFISGATSADFHHLLHEAHSL